jgi:hypothetical protein
MNYKAGNIMVQNKTIVLFMVHKNFELINRRTKEVLEKKDKIVKAIVELYKKVAKYRIPVVDENMFPLKVLDRSYLENNCAPEYFISKVIKDASVKSKFGNKQDEGLATVAPKTLLEEIIDIFYNNDTNYEHIFVTKNGDEKSLKRRWQCRLKHKMGFTATMGNASCSFV